MVFQETLLAVPGIFADKEEIDRGSNIILPNSALKTIINNNIQPPFYFKITSCEQKEVYCGVADFTADEEEVIVPYWMMEHLKINPNDPVIITNTVLKKGSYVKIRPHQYKFIQLKDPKEILENYLSKFFCLTKETTIPIHYEDDIYMIDILEVKCGDDNCNSVSIIDTDLKIDFERPIDMPESPKKQPMSFKPLTFPPQKSASIESVKEEEKKFVPFTGAGRVLGKSTQTDQKSCLLSILKPGFQCGDVVHLETKVKMATTKDEEILLSAPKKRNKKNK